MLPNVLKSILLVAGVAAVAAWPFTYLGVGLISGFLFFSVLQFVGFYFYREHQQRKIAIEEQKLILIREEQLNKQGAEVTCPCDRNIKCFVPIVLNDRNEYTCPGCNKDINVMVNLKTALITTPVLESTEEVIAKQLHEH